MKSLYAIALILLFASCKTVKYVDREKIITDSSAIEQNEGLQKVLSETIERYEAEREQWEKTGIVFDTIRKNDTVTINKVVFDNGRIKSAEGRLLAVNFDLHEKNVELLDSRRIIDSLSLENKRKEVALSKKQETIVKQVRKTVWPFWLFGMLLATGLFLEYRFSILKRTLKLFL